jgi:cytochrome P450
MTTSDPSRLLDPKAHADGEAEETWRWMRTHEPVAFHDESTFPPFWSLTRYDDVRDAYSRPDIFSSEGGVLLRPRELGDDPGGGLTLALIDPPRHRDIRALLAPRFSEGCARSLADEMRADVRRVLSQAAEVDEVDFAHDVAARLSSLLIARLIGVPEVDFDRVTTWVEEAFAAAQPITSHMTLVQYLIELMYDRMEEPRQDAMSLLVDGEIDGKLFDETEIILNCENLVGASENAGLSIAAGIAAFLEHPNQWRALAADRGLLPTAVEEILRWASSATHSMRTATRDIEVGNRTITAGERVVLWVRSANRDESAFNVPETFDIARRPNRHLALGAGEHICIGQTMARHQLRILLDELLCADAVLEAAGPAVPLASIAVNGPARLPVRVRLR